MASEPQSLHPKDLPKSVAAILSSFAIALFLFYGFLMLPMLGLQSDEIMFVYDLFHPNAAFAWFRFFHHDVAYMMMTYLGSLKSWLYAPLFAITSPSVWAIRAPTLLIAALTILLAGWLLRRIDGWNAALIVICLLATDVVFELTAVFDWGPVVLQNFLLVLGILFLVEWHRSRRNLFLFAGGFIFGLNMWNKALFIWNFSGIGIALLLVALPEIIQLWRIRRAAILLLGFCLGAAPLIIFNIEFPLITFRDNSHLSLSEVGAKANYLKWSLDGQTAPAALILQQYPAAEPVHRPFQSIVLSLAGKLSQPVPNTWRFFSGLTLVLLGLAAGTNTQRRWILFFFVAGFIGWFESAMTLNAGNSLHHTVLFWINWYCAVALGGACLARLKFPFTSPAIFVLILVLSVRGVVNENLTYANLLSFSPDTAWTDADETLSASLLKSGVKRAIVADWGIANPISVESEGKIDVTENQEFELNAGRFNAGPFAACASPDCVVVTHSPDRMMFSTVAEKLDESLRQNHLVKSDTKSIKDSRGFSVFSVFSLRPQLPGDTDTDNKTVLPASRGVLSAFAAHYAQFASFRFWATATPEQMNRNGAVQVIHWSVPGVEQVQIRVQSPTGALFAIGGSSGNAITGPWANPGEKLYLEISGKGDGQASGSVLAELVFK